MTSHAGVDFTDPRDPELEAVLPGAALAFVARLHREFEPRRQALLRQRAERARRLDAGERPDFPAATADLRAAEWTIAPQPTDLLRRRVEITGPVERKMMINAFNSGADTYMADFEDSNAPDWAEPDPGPAQSGGCRAPAHRIPGARRHASTGSTSASPRCWCGRAAGTWTRSTCWSTASA